ncbi:MAG: BatA domain-containing protein [Planctomycetes bacterium]|nr:BatA domain-containing protein [Planctomycetota bacterium]
MSFLAPLYILGALGLALPVLFHLIRRTPRGHLPFSSLMFLAPTPPRLTRRSRLDNLLLLLLRCAALALLALAFARPFLREASALLLADHRQRYVAVLLDTSASMRRAGLWQAATERVERFLSETTPMDRVAMLTFDDRATIRVGFEDLEQVVTPSNRRDLVRQRLSKIQPGWAGTDLGTALTTTADLLDSAADAERDQGDVDLLIVLISDLQQGSELAALRAFEWPARVRLRIEPVTSEDPTNAGLQTLDAAEGQADADGKVRLRVVNDADSATEQFRVQPIDDDSSPSSADQIYVPAGQTRVVRVPAPKDPEQGAVYRIVGDAHDFDNTAYLAPRLRQRSVVVYVGNDSTEDPEGLSYYLNLALTDTREREFDFITITPDMALPVGEQAGLIIVADSPVEQTEQQISRFLASGGRVLQVIRDRNSMAALQRLLAIDRIAVEEPPIDDYALLAEIDWSHPLFAPFSGSKYGDFTKIHFWNYRRLDLPDDAPIDVLARFDSGDVAVCERRFPGGGRLTIFTSGWNPSDSQLAMSTKFVPLISQLLTRGEAKWSSSFHVGQPVTLPEDLGPLGNVTIARPDGTSQQLAAGETRYLDTDRPGIYRAVARGREYAFAVNVDASESRTSPLEIEELEQAGVLLAGMESVTAVERKERQMRDLELERQQQLWRWLIIGAIAFLLAETYLAGRAARPLPTEA